MVRPYATVDHLAPLLAVAEPTERAHVVRLTAPLTVYKKAVSRPGVFPRYTIVTLELPVGTLVVTTALAESSGYYPIKFRVSEARVVAFGDKSTKLARSSHDSSFVYRIGETVKPRRAFSLANLHCASGLHVYLTYAEARMH